MFYTNAPNMSVDAAQAMKKEIKAAKGVGNFKSLFVHIPKGDEKAVQILPVGDIGTKDEFERIKNITRNDIVSAHRMNPALAGIIPENIGGHGDITKAATIYAKLEIQPLLVQLGMINDYLTQSRAIQWDLKLLSLEE